MVSFNHLPFPPSTFCTVCKFMCTFGGPAFCLHLWLTSSLHTSLVSIEMVVFCIGSLSVQSMVNTRILGLVPPDSCAMPQFHVVRTSGISQARLHSASRTNASTSHFKLNRVIETWVTSSIPYPCPQVPVLIV